MKISTKARYGMRAMLELASHGQRKTLSVREIAEKQDISLKYLSLIMSTLKAAGLVRSVAGKHGGFSLSRAPQKITLLEVFHALEGSTAPVECVDYPGFCPMAERCVTRDIWTEIKQSMDRILKSKTLQSLAYRKKKKNGTRA